jgi:hypothetical protein
MIDWTKIELPAVVGAQLLTHPALSFSGKFDRATGAIYGDEPAIANYGPTVALGRTNEPSDPRRALRFIVYPGGRAILEGSWHKYGQYGTNWGDFTFTQFVAAVTEVCNTFQLDPFSLRLLQCEVGGNIFPPIRTHRVLRAFVCHREGHPFAAMRARDGKSLGLELYRDQYGVKLYDKGRQFQLDHDVLRGEVKFTKAVQLHALNIYTLGDLLNVDAWQRLRDRVMDIFDELVIAEPSIDLQRLTTSQRTFATLATAATYWEGLTKEQRYKSRNRYTALVERYAGRNLKAELRALLLGKFAQLLNEEGHLFTDSHNVTPPMAGSPFHGSVNVGISDLVEAVNLCPPEVVEIRRCPECGRDITNQDPRSRVCSERLYGKEGKRCRNALSNRTLSLRRMNVRSAPLFDQQPFIRPPRNPQRHANIVGFHPE